MIYLFDSFFRTKKDIPVFGNHIYFKKYKGEQVIDWTKCCTTNLFDREGEELTYDSFKKMVDGKMNRYDLSHISQEIVVRTK